MKKSLSLILSVILFITSFGYTLFSISKLQRTEKWVATKISFESEKTYENPVYSVDLDVKFTHKKSGKTFTQPAFWNGGKNWAVRVALNETGLWYYETICSDTKNQDLNGKTGEIFCTKYKGNLDIYKHGFVKVEEGKRYFVYDDGTPFFYLGDTHWTLPLEEIEGIGDIDEETALENNITSQFKYIMDYRAEQGYTVIQSQPLGYYEGQRGNSWFGDYFGSIFDQGIDEYMIEQFIEYDKYFEYIAEKGFVHANTQFSYPSELITAYSRGFITEREIEKLCRFWVARYSAYPVMWTTTQEGDNDYYAYGGCTPDTNPWLMVMEYISKYDVYNHPSTCHQEYVRDTCVINSIFKENESHDWFAAQYPILTREDSTPPFVSLKEYWNNKGKKPVINYEGRYDQYQLGSLGARAQGWVAFLNGNYGYGYGVQPIWSLFWSQNGYVGPMNNETEYWDRSINWLEGLKSECGQQLIYMKKFLENYEWYNLEPCFDNSEYYKPNTANYSVAHNDNKTYIGYFYGRDNDNWGELLNMKNGQYKVTWFNCRTGASKISTINIKNKTYKIPPKPDELDWAIAVEYIG